jgi:hypothetical protein
MEGFFKRIIEEADKHWVGYFMKGWEKSVGATVEHGLFQMLGFRVEHLTKTAGFLN